MTEGLEGEGKGVIRGLQRSQILGCYQHEDGVVSLNTKAIVVPYC